MSATVLDFQDDLPRAIPLYRYLPSRRPFDWKAFDPGRVRQVEHLPSYLIMGTLDPQAFRADTNGWLARWRGVDDGTFLAVAYEAATRDFRIRQQWLGMDGGMTYCSSALPLDQAIARMLYSTFPAAWDREAKRVLEEAWQVAVIALPEGAISLCGIPDGAFRTIAFPLAVPKLRPVSGWLDSVLGNGDVPYPVSAQARLFFQAVNHVEGLEGREALDPSRLFRASVEETGLAPYGVPVREKGRDGTSALTVRRDLYAVFIGVPFAGLADLLRRIASVGGPIRPREAEPVPGGLDPLVFAQGLELQSKSVAFWNRSHSVRSFWQLERLRDGIGDMGNAWLAAESGDEDRLAVAEFISERVTAKLMGLPDPAGDGIRSRQ